MEDYYNSWSQQGGLFYFLGPTWRTIVTGLTRRIIVINWPNMEDYYNSWSQQGGLFYFLGPTWRTIVINWSNREDYCN
jgi:hypothetical protein